MIKVGGYVLGEFGNLIAGDPRSSPMVQFQLLHRKFPLSSTTTKALLLSSYIKLINLFPEIKSAIQDVSSKIYLHLDIFLLLSISETFYFYRKEECGK